jgi:tRNA threonylcarbamoyladenosine biosynthesis protein TsaE
MILASEADTDAVGQYLAAQLRIGDVIALSGPLGVGKTALARAMIKALGHEGEVPSPSFAIVQPYETLDPPLWHVDLYRIDQTDEIAEMGLENAMDDASIVVEWPERAGLDMWPEALQLSLDFAPNGARRLTAQVPTAWEARWPPR